METSHYVTVIYIFYFSLSFKLSTSWYVFELRQMEKYLHGSCINYKIIIAPHWTHVSVTADLGQRMWSWSVLDGSHMNVVLDIQLGANPEGRPQHAGGSDYLTWPGNASGCSRRPERKCPLGFPCFIVACIQTSTEERKDVWMWTQRFHTVQQRFATSVMSTPNIIFQPLKNVIMCSKSLNLYTQTFLSKHFHIIQ